MDSFLASDKLLPWHCTPSQGPEREGERTANVKKKKTNAHSTSQNTNCHKGDGTQYNLGIDEGLNGQQLVGMVFHEPKIGHDDVLPVITGGSQFLINCRAITVNLAKYSIYSCKQNTYFSLQ